jgi:3-oxoacyl-[acyl-carrier protein] reductase
VSAPDDSPADDELPVAGRVFLVTGAASGIGLAAAHGLLAEGAMVGALDVDRAGLERLAADGAVPLVADVADSGQVVAAADELVGTAGRLDGLVANVGVPAQGPDGTIYRRTWPLHEYPEGIVERTMAVNAFGTYYALRAALPHMHRGGQGRVVSVISRAIELPSLEGVAYGASKAAQWSFTMAAAAEIGDADICINCLIPGPTNTAIFGRDMPQLQPPEAVFPAVRRLLTVPKGGPNGRVFFKLTEYRMFSAENKIFGMKPSEKR